MNIATINYQKDYLSTANNSQTNLLRNVTHLSYHQKLKFNLYSIVEVNHLFASLLDSYLSKMNYLMTLVFIFTTKSDFCNVIYSVLDGFQKAVNI